MSNLTGQQIWDALQEDVNFTSNHPESVREAIKPFVLEIPVVLADLLNSVVSFSSLMSAKVKYVEYLLNNNFIRVLSEAIPLDALSIFPNRDAYAEFVNGFLSELIVVTREIIKNLDAFLSESGITEEQIMLQDQIGFNEEMKARYLSRTLTIEDLLLEQPWVVIKTTQ